jgi:hypothetical protein
LELDNVFGESKFLVMELWVRKQEVHLKFDTQEYTISLRRYNLQIVTQIVISSLESSHPSIHLSIYLWLYSPFLDLHLFFSFLIQCTFDRTSWTGEQSVARPLSAHRTTHIHRINAPRHGCLSDGIRTHDCSIRAGEESSCLRPRGNCDRLILKLLHPILNIQWEPKSSYRRSRWTHTRLFFREVFTQGTTYSQTAYVIDNVIWIFTEERTSDLRTRISFSWGPALNKFSWTMGVPWYDIWYPIKLFCSTYPLFKRNF